MKNLVMVTMAVSAFVALSADLADRVKTDFADYGEKPFVHYAVPPMSDVQRLVDVYPSDGVANGVVRIHAAKGEYEPGSFSVWGVKDLGKVRFELGEFKRVEVKGGERGTGVVFPGKNLDLKVVKCWYQNLNGWFSYFSDSGDWKLCPELLLNDEDLIRCDAEKKANYAKIVGEDGKPYERWINPPREFDSRTSLSKFWIGRSSFNCMQPGFHDAATLQPVTVGRNQFRNFFLTAHVTKEVSAGTYRGAIQLKQSNNSNNQTILGSIPVEIVVHDFELPHPKCYNDPSRDFLVASYSYIDIGYVMDANGGDRELAAKQFEQVFRNQAEHNQAMHMIRMGFGSEQRFTIEAMRKGGMRTDVLMAMDVPSADADAAKRRESAKQFAAALDRTYGHHNYIFMYGDEPGINWFKPVVPRLTDYQQFGFKHLMAGTWGVYQAAGFVYDWANISQRPEENGLLKQWNASGADHVAWYANHHIGTENPSLNRRQNGLDAWLSGYTCFCNYAHHFGPYNDDSEYYKPMVYAYGTGNGVIDTIAWEGFREGLDDIRYATLLCQLAAKAEKAAAVETRQLGRKAKMTLAQFKGDADDMSACRAEMTRYIEELLKVVKADPVVPYPVAQAKVDAAEEKAFAEEAKPYVDAVRAAKTPHQTLDATRRAKAFYASRYRTRELNELLGDELAAAEDRFDFKRVREIKLAKLRDPKGDRNRRELMWELLGDEPSLGKDPALRALWTDDPKTNAVIGQIWGAMTRRLELQCEKKFPVLTWFYALSAEMADKTGNKDFPAAAAVICAEAFAVQGDAKGVQAVVDRALANPKVKSEDAYKLKLFARLFAEGVKKPLLIGTREKDAQEAVAEFDAENRGELKPKQRLSALERVGVAANLLNDEELLRALVAYRTSLFRPAPRKRYTVRYTAKDALMTADWSTLGITVDKAEYDRQYGGSLEMMDTDVTTGSRRVGKSGEEIPNTVMQVVADAWGLHFRFVNRDPKARQVELGTVAGGSFEGYIAPGKNEPYVCFFMNDGEDRLGVFNTQYASVGHREITDKDPRLYRLRTVFTDDAIMTCLSLSWENYMERVPQNGSVWDFENMRWDRAGGNAWNGVKTIHGRSTWGELVFEMPEAARAAILRRVAARAYAGFKREVLGDGRLNHYYGCVRQWTDPFTGDADFFEKNLKPWSEALLERGKTLDVVSDADVFALEADGTLSAWRNVRILTGARRAAWLAGERE